MASIWMLLAFVLFVVPSLSSAGNEHVDFTKGVRYINRTSFVKFLQGVKTGVNLTQEKGKTHVIDKIQQMKGAREKCGRSLVLVYHNGQYGNTFTEWASALGVAKRLTEALPRDFKRMVALPTQEWSRLTEVFDGVLQKTIKQIMQRRTVILNNVPTSCIKIFPDFDSVAQDIDTAGSELAFYSPQTVAGNKPVVLNVGEGFEPAIATVIRDLRTTLSFRQHISDRAAKILRSLVDQTKHLYNREGAKVITVGMHARHHDFPELFEQFYGAPAATDKYFVNALRWMVWTTRKSPDHESFNVEDIPVKSASLNETLDKLHVNQVVSPPAQKLPATPIIAVAIISDDMHWVNKSLLPALHMYIRAENVAGVQMYGAGSDDPKVDLALLARCNHTIISYGAYGVTGAIFSGGRTVVYDMNNPNNFATSIAKFFPHWVVME